MESILNSIKEMLGMTADYKPFDTQIIIHINSALMVLNDIGVGPKQGFMISSESETWEQFLGYSSIADSYIVENEPIKFEHVKTYVYLKVKLIFDPPSSSAVLDAMKRQADELEWRLNVRAETITTEGG